MIDRNTGGATDRRTAGWRLRGGIAAATLGVGGILTAGLMGFGQHAGVAESLTAAAIAQPAGANAWKVDKVHSGVNFMILRGRLDAGGIAEFHGRFNEIDGTFTFDPANPATARFDFRVPIASIDTANSRRDDDLKGPSFFNARQFPEMRFQSTGVTPVEAGRTYKLAGNLTLAGETRPIEAELTWKGQGEMMGKRKAGFTAEFTVDRAAHGITKYTETMSKDVRITVWIEADPA